MTAATAAQLVSATNGPIFETIDEAMIARLVHAFYAEIRRDLWLGPIFEQRIHDWNAHLGQMCAFWSSVMLKSGRYHGTPMQKHMALPVERAHFVRWLDLFAMTAHRICPTEAPRFEAAAQRIAQSLELGIETHRHRLPGNPTD